MGRGCRAARTKSARRSRVGGGCDLWRGPEPCGRGTGCGDPGCRCQQATADRCRRRAEWDGRGNLSQKALQEFVLWFLRVCVDQVTFMSGLFELDRLAERFETYVLRSPDLK